MNRAGVLSTLVLIAILTACGRSAEEVATANSTVQAASAATRAAMPTATNAPTEVAPADATPGPTDVSAAVTGDAAHGETLFNQSFTTSSGPWICTNCHSTGSNRLIGPGLGGIAQRAATRIEGLDAPQYIIQSITHPNDFIVPADASGEYPQGLMPQNYAELLSEQDLNDLVAYLLTLQ